MKKLTKKERHFLINVLVIINQYWYAERNKGNPVAQFILDETHLLIEKLETGNGKNDWNCYAGLSPESEAIYEMIKKMNPPAFEELYHTWFDEMNKAARDKNEKDNKASPKRRN